MIVPSPLLMEHETLLNTALAASSLQAFAKEYNRSSKDKGASLWHLMTVLPLVFNRTSRTAISKRRRSSGLRSILQRDPAIEVAQNEAIHNIDKRIRLLADRTFRALNVAIASGLIAVTDGLFYAGRIAWKPEGAMEAKEILNCAGKLGGWASDGDIFEYLTVLGVNPSS